MCFALNQFLKQRYTTYVSTPSDGKLDTSNQVPSYDNRLKVIQAQKMEHVDKKSIQSVLSKELREEILSIKETLRKEIKLELSNIQKSLKDNLAHNSHNKLI